MIDERKEAIRFKWSLKIYLIYILNGIRKIYKSKRLTVGFVIYLILVALLGTGLVHISPDYSSPFVFIDILAECSYLLLVAALLIYVSALFCYIVGKPRGAKQMCDNFKRAGIVNHLGEAPLLMSKTVDTDNFRLNVYELYISGIPFDSLQDRASELESALNLKIDRFEPGDNSRRVLMFAADGDQILPKRIDWKDEYLDRSGFNLILGESLVNRVSVDLNNIPHILIGGSTGSGKSVLLKLLLMQCVEKGAEVYIADFKGGIDFPSVWHKKCKIITERDDLTALLKEIVIEVNRRKALLSESETVNLDKYNRKTGKRLKRIIIACDEIAEVLDKTGLSKEDKAVVQEIEGMLAIIARLGRAIGINLILSTQRPDANILSGQIKNNIGYRVCGRADNILSQIILDKSDANDKVSKTAQGRFLDNNDTLFQAYWFDENGW